MPLASVGHLSISLKPLGQSTQISYGEKQMKPAIQDAHYLYKAIPARATTNPSPFTRLL